jgi:hypothetical protein
VRSVPYKTPDIKRPIEIIRGREERGSGRVQASVGIKRGVVEP